MPKVVNKKFQQRPDKKDSKKDGNATNTASAASAASRAFGPLFNKDLGQHILKNPLVAQGIVDKVQRFSAFLTLGLLEYLSPSSGLLSSGSGSKTLHGSHLLKNPICHELSLGLLAPHRYRPGNWSRYRKLDSQDLGEVQEGCCCRDGSPSRCRVDQACPRNVRPVNVSTKASGYCISGTIAIGT